MTKAEMFLDRLNRFSLVFAINNAVATINERQAMLDDSEDNKELYEQCQAYLSDINDLKKRVVGLEQLGVNYEQLADALYDLVNDADGEINFDGDVTFELLDSGNDEPIMIFMSALQIAYTDASRWQPSSPHVNTINQHRDRMDVVAQELGYYLDLVGDERVNDNKTEYTLMLRSVHVPFDVDAFLAADDTERNHVLSTMIGCELFNIVADYNSYEGETFDIRTGDDVTPVEAVLVPVLQFHGHEED